MEERSKVKNFEEIINALRNLLGEKSVTVEPEKLSRFRVDHLTPEAVVFPKNTNQVSDVIKLAHTHNLAIVPWGSGPQMAMGNLPKEFLNQEQIKFIKAHGSAGVTRLKKGKIKGNTT